MFGDKTGYDICGERTYEVFEKNPDTGSLEVIEFAKLSRNDNTGNMDIVVETEKREDIGGHDMILQVTLIAYNIV